MSLIHLASACEKLSTVEFTSDEVEALATFFSADPGELSTFDPAQSTGQEFLLQVADRVTPPSLRKGWAFGKPAG